MTITGIIHENTLWVGVKLSGHFGSKEIFFRIDTGFDGELSLPVNLAIPLGLPLIGESEYNIAGGGKTAPFKFIASMQWGSQTKLVSVDVDRGSIPLLGMRLLTDYTLFADFKKKTLIISEAVPDKIESKEKPDEETK